jgi:hypothetical protein
MYNPAGERWGYPGVAYRGVFPALLTGGTVGTGVGALASAVSDGAMSDGASMGLVIGMLAAIVFLVYAHALAFVLLLRGGDYRET